jgi:hypothetical protein
MDPFAVTFDSLYPRPRPADFGLFDDPASVNDQPDFGLFDGTASVDDQADFQVGPFDDTASVNVLSRFTANLNFVELTALKFVSDVAEVIFGTGGSESIVVKFLVLAESP